MTLNMKMTFTSLQNDLHECLKRWQLVGPLQSHSESAGGGTKFIYLNAEVQLCGTLLECFNFKWQLCSTIFLYSTKCTFCSTLSQRESVAKLGSNTSGKIAI